MDVLLAVPGPLHLGEHDLVMPVGHRVVEGHRAGHPTRVAEIRVRGHNQGPLAVPVWALIRLGSVNGDGLRIPFPDVIIGPGSERQRVHRIQQRRRLEDQTAARATEIEVLGVRTTVGR